MANNFGKRKFGGGGFKRRRFSGSRKKFVKRGMPLRMQKPVSVKFAAPVQRAKLEWTTVYNSQCADDGKNGITGLANCNLEVWNNVGANAHADGSGLGILGLATIGNSGYDPGDNGNNLNFNVAHGALCNHAQKPVAFDEWMKLYRKCYITGSKIYIRFHGALSGAQAATNVNPGPLGVTMHLSPSELCANGVNNYTEIFQGAPWSTSGNKNQRQKWIIPRRAPFNGAATEVQLFESSIGMFKTSKAVFGLKSIFGDDQYSCTASANPTKKWTWNWYLTPAQPGFMKGMAVVKCTFWCTFASRKSVAQAGAMLQ